MIIIGIDPGLSGAVATLHSDGSMGLSDTPVTEVVVGRKKQRRYLEVEMARTLGMVTLARDYPAGDSAIDRSLHAFIEDVHAMPKQGVSSVFRFGYGYGLWCGILAALRIPVTRVTPQAWKKAVGRCAEKGQARIRAAELFPSAAGCFSRVKDDGRAEAALIAWYGARTVEGK